MTETLFPTLDSPAPRLAQLRTKYAEALAAWEAANKHEDESGEAVPWTLRKRLEEARTQLLQEEAKQALVTGQ